MRIALARCWRTVAAGCCAFLATAMSARAEDAGQFTWGQILDADTGKPVAGALVDAAGGQSLTTDATGSFFFPRAVATLQVRREGYTSQTLSIDRPSLVLRRERLAPTAGPSLQDSGVTVRLRHLPVFRPLPNHLTLGWRPDSLQEGHAGNDGFRFNTAGPRPAAAWLDGGVHLGSTLLTGNYTSQLYRLTRSDSRESFGRWQHQGTLGLGYAHQWGSGLAAAIGPAVVFQQINLLDPPAAQNRTKDYLDVASSRWGAGLQATIATWPWATLPITADARFGWFPATWQLTDSLNLVPQGLWALQGSAGLRWYPVPTFAFDCRYLYDHWQTSAYYQGSHGMTLGGTLVF
jgi:hypothetical protein